MGPRATGGAERLALAQAFLREAVYRSRASQAAGGVFSQGETGAAGRCGLGERAAPVLDLTQEGADLFARLWPGTLPAGHVERIRERMNAWVVEQDALDRKRNHFIKAFRQQHGFDRLRWTSERAAEFDAGIARISAAEDEARAAAAQELVQAE